MRAVAEIRGLIMRFSIRRLPKLSFILEWSIWRRKHQALAMIAHSTKLEGIYNCSIKTQFCCSSLRANAVLARRTLRGFSLKSLSTLLLRKRRRGAGSRILNASKSTPVE